MNTAIRIILATTRAADAQAIIDNAHALAIAEAAALAAKEAK